MTNYAGIHKHEILAAIEAAPDHDTLKAIDADLEREGWTPTGVLRTRIAARHSELDAPQPAS